MAGQGQGLFSPMTIGNCHLNHRLVMAPLTRLRAAEDNVPLPMVAEYYSQRAGVPGTLLIAEATSISYASAGRDVNAPGIWTAAQIEGWKKVTSAVHSKNSFVFLQLWHVGRAARQTALQAKGIDMVSSSDVPIEEAEGGSGIVPRPMTEEEIEQCIKDFGVAAHNAVEKAGFDGVEIHAANGYLIDQFLQDTCNRRSDRWGGSVENRSRFCRRVVEEVVGAIGPERTGIRLSPFSPFAGMGMADPIPQFTHVIRGLKVFRLAYLHLVEPRVAGNQDVDPRTTQNLEFAVREWDKDSPLLLAGGYDGERAKRAVEHDYKDRQVAIVFGRHWISNPDLPYRLKHGLELSPYDRGTFYAVKQAHGYIDYPFYEDFPDARQKVISAS
ncbi:hypothetical protein LTR72_006890 [Exophiala xenobiotica]|nr:hypothetical protein LTR72_006890 [Exophiala xenobiotica]KAK5287104.1 hypothetical protein LTR14_009521 [Exophiala xenobiotica]KAK5474873.1 hypothetical protein LTR55_009491 [Exophiala xenobiotica]